MKNILNIYIKNITYDDIYNYVSNNYDYVTEDEIKVIYKYIKNRWEDIYDNKNNVFSDLKKEVSSKCYKEIISLINKYEHLKK